MEAQAASSRSIAGHLRAAWAHAARLALDIALPTLCVACREPVAGLPYCPGHSRLAYRPGSRQRVAQG